MYPLCMLLILLCFKPHRTWFLWFSMGCFWALIHQFEVNERHMPSTALLTHVKLTGFVDSIPNYANDKVQFQFAITHLNNQVVKTRALLSCYNHCPNFHAGECWQFVAKLKKPRNLGNPGAFNYQRQLSAHHMYWTGYIKPSTAIKLPISHYTHWLLKKREQLAEQLQHIITRHEALGVVQALTLGISHQISLEQWNLFRQTGTTHLMVISGAHIGLVAGSTYTIVYWFLRRVYWLCIRVPAQKIAAIIAVFVAIIYSLFAGFGAPAQRALIACLVMMVKLLGIQQLSAWQAWRYALFTVLLLEPHHVLLPGFYLSFLAVAAMLIMHQRFHYQGIKKTLLLQFSCLVGLMPLTLLWFSYGAVIGFLANLIAIPWVSLIIIPLSFVVLLLHHYVISGFFIAILQHAIHGLLFFLNGINVLAFINLQGNFIDVLAPLIAMLVMLIGLCLPIKSFFPPLIVLLLALLKPAHEKVPIEDARVELLDVGQGLSVLIRTAHHALLYDTGAKFYRGTDMGLLAIIPYLKTIGLKKIDTIVVSHTDLDHRGGLSSIEAIYPSHQLIVDDPNYYHRGVSCHTYAPWQWDGIEFKFFPINVPLGSKNNHSCVLQVKSKGGQFLLTGDIEQEAEKYLVDTYKDTLASTAMLVPHHGSKTSSSLAFIKQVAPRYALLSYGFDNRYHFPHAQTINHYQSHHVELYNTMEQGKICLQLTPQGVSAPTTYKD